MRVPVLLTIYLEKATINNDNDK